MSGNKLLARGGPRAVGLDVKGFVSYKKVLSVHRWSEVVRDRS